ncbi:MAG: family 16 glycoside hydrolase [Planctomycetota bacterium]
MSAPCSMRFSGDAIFDCLLRPALTLVLIVCCSASARSAEAISWQSLTNDDELTGWTHNGNWKCQDGVIIRTGKGGNLTYQAKPLPDDFELQFEWKVGEGSNSGVYYRPGQYEYQILDNDKHRDGANPRTSAASLYFCMPPSHDATHPVGEWNEGTVICQGTVIQHWLNGSKVVDFDYTDPQWADNVEMLRLRGADLSARGGKLWLQDHGDPVSYRNIRFRALSAGEDISHATITPAEISEEIRAAEQKKLQGILQRRQKQQTSDAANGKAAANQVRSQTLVSRDNITANVWLHWRGPTGNGVAPDSNPPVRFSSTENVRWKTPIPGLGSGSPIVLEDRVFVVTAIPKANPGRPNAIQPMSFDVLCYSRDDGSLRWQRTAVTATPHQETHSTNGFASASPCSNGSHVFAHFGSRGLYCYTIEGELVWERKDLGRMITRNGFGEGSSPTLASDAQLGDVIIVPWDHEGASSLFVLQQSNGKTIWKVDRDEPTNWGTPLVVDTAQGPQVVVTGQNLARGYDLRTGKQLWSCPGQTQRPVASPVSIGEMAIVTSGFRGSYLGAFDLNGRGNLEGSRALLWTRDRDTPDIASPVLSENRLYFFKGKSGVLSCVDVLTGRPFYERQRIPGLSYLYASPVVAGGHVYMTDRSGAITVMKDAERLEVVAENQMGETVDATPAPVGDQLFIRGEQHLFCIE